MLDIRSKGLLLVIFKVELEFFERVAASATGTAGIRSGKCAHGKLGRSKCKVCSWDFPPLNGLLPAAAEGCSNPQDFAGSLHGCRSVLWWWGVSFPFSITAKWKWGMEIAVPFALGQNKFAEQKMEKCRTRKCRFWISGSIVRGRVELFGTSASIVWRQAGLGWLRRLHSSLLLCFVCIM